MRRVSVTVLLVLALAAAAWAKPKKSGFGDMNQSLMVTPMGGLAFPTGDFSNSTDMGFTVGANLEYFVAPRVALSSNFSLQSFGQPDTAVGDSPDFFFIGAGARGFLFDDTKMNPYGRVAGGLYQGNSESNTGVNLGAGLLYRASARLGVFGEGSIHFIFDTGTGAASSTATFFGFTGGLFITIPTGR